MSDAGRIYADDVLSILESSASEVYADAEYKANMILAEYLSDKKKSEAALGKKLEKGTITEKEYRAKRRNLLCSGAEWERALEDMSVIYTEALLTISGMLEGAIPAVFARNAAWAEYEIYMLTGKELNGGIYTADDAIKRAELLTLPSVDTGKDMRWNRQRITAEMMQALAAGKSISEMANVLQDVTDGAHGGTLGTVRALITAAECGGRQYIYRAAAGSDVAMRKTWRSIHDHRVRASHKGADGQAVMLDDTFLVGGEALMYPGDPSGSAANVKNCRCGMEITISGKALGHWDPEDFARWLDAREAVR